jgi:hypothetical protein
VEDDGGGRGMRRGTFLDGEDGWICCSALMLVMAVMAGQGLNSELVTAVRRGGCGDHFKVQIPKSSDLRPSPFKLLFPYLLQYRPLYVKDNQTVLEISLLERGRVGPQFDKT